MISAARLPTASLMAMAGLRADDAVRVFVQAGECWLQWPEGREDVLPALRPVPGVEFYDRRNGRWHRAGERLPADDAPPEGHWERLANRIFPDRFAITGVESHDLPKVPLQLVRGGSPQSATALACYRHALTAWGETATSAELRSIRAAVSGDRAVLMGAKLPSIPRAVRYWGTELFAPVGFQIAPALPTAMILQAVGAGRDEFAFFQETGIEIVPKSAFEPVTRAALRMAVPS